MDEQFWIVAVDPALLAAERDRVLAHIRALVPHAEVLEVGSTAIAGVVGKGDLDLLVRAPAEQFVRVREQLDAAFARNPDQLSTDVYQGYLVPSPLDVAIQLTVAGGPHDNFVAFVDALRASPDLVAAYNALKRRWHGREMDGYREEKGQFVERVLGDL